MRLLHTEECSSPKERKKNRMHFRPKKKKKKCWNMLPIPPLSDSTTGSTQMLFQLLKNVLEWHSGAFRLNSSPGAE